MISFIKKINFILQADKLVSQNNKEAEWKTLTWTAFITSAAYLMMSILNVFQKSYIMLLFTIGSSLILLITFIIGRKNRKIKLFQNVYFLMNMIVLTIFLIKGGNNGFAALWIILTPFVSMSLVDLRKGFLVSIYFLLMLVTVLSGPLSFLLQWNYDSMFRLRFPFLFVVSDVLALFIVTRSRRYQYELILGRKELERISTTDLNTGLMNRNKFDQFRKSFVPQKNCTLSAVFIDLNGLHAINNTQGHEAGDRMLKAVASNCLEKFSTDLIYRMGGDEILILAYKRTNQELELILKQMSSELEKESYSISYGIVTEADTTNLMQLVGAADKKMLQYKDNYYKTKNIEHR